MNDLIAYSYDFISYLGLQPIWRSLHLRRIILYGSVVRGDYNKKSDVDIFIDVVEDRKKQERLEKQLSKIKRNFFLSPRINKWKALGIKNDFSLIIGNLEEKKWLDLRRSISFSGTLIWGRYTKVPKEKLESYILLKWNLPAKDNKKRVSLSRKLYGYTQKDKRYPGLLEKFKCRSFGRGMAIIPAQYINHFRKLLNQLKISYQAKDVYF